MIKQNFNKNWTVKKTSTSMTDSVLETAEVPREQVVTLPHDAMIFENRNPKNPAAGACGFYPGGDYEYTKTFFVDKDEKDQTFYLEFEGIYNRGYVYVNGALAGSTHYGYTGLCLDITPYLNYDCDNTVLVKAINSDVPNSRWYTGSGLYRPVFLYKGGTVHISVDGLKVSTPEIEKNLAVVKSDINIIYDAKPRKTIIVKSEIFDADGTSIATESSKTTLFSRTSTVQTQRIYVKNPVLWSLDTPHLYTLKTTLYDGDVLLDSAETTFGIRKLELNPIEGLKLNGKSILLRGGCLHHDNGPVGAATFDRAEERRIELLKNAGFNSVRIAHNSSSKALLNACDRLGMLVMEESYDTWTQAKSQFDSSLVFVDHWEKDIEDIVRKDFNHPSVFMYSIGNEILSLGTPEGAKWSRRLSEKFRELDPTRYVTNAINGLCVLMDHIPKVLLDLGMLTEEQLQAMSSPTSDEESGGDINDAMTSLLGQMNYLSTHPDVEDLLNEAYGTIDLLGLNYMRDVYDQMKEFPNRIFYGSETLPPDIDLNWAKVKELSACIGDYTWTAWDYIGEAGVGIVTYDTPLTFLKAYPAYLAYCGDLDINGFRRPTSYFREIVFGLRKKPYIAVQIPEHYEKEMMCTPWSMPECISSWTWNGSEGKPCKVEVYSDAPEVELFINGNSIGKLPSGEENRFRTVFDTIYEPGEIKATAYYADGQTEDFTLTTAQIPSILYASADKQLLSEDELTYIDIEVHDENGVLNTSSDCKVHVTVEGSGHLQALSSADPYSEENFFDQERTTYYGRALAVIRADKKGTILVHIKSDELDPVSIEIKVQ